MLFSVTGSAILGPGLPRRTAINQGTLALRSSPARTLQTGRINIPRTSFYWHHWNLSSQTWFAQKRQRSFHCAAFPPFTQAFFQNALAGYPDAKKTPSIRINLPDGNELTNRRNDPGPPNDTGPSPSRVQISMRERAPSKGQQMHSSNSEAGLIPPMATH